MLKYVMFGEGINVMFGLLIICMLVDYGIVFDLVGMGCVDLGSMIVVFDMVVMMVCYCCVV